MFANKGKIWEISTVAIVMVMIMAFSCASPAEGYAVKSSTGDLTINESTPFGFSKTIYSKDLASAPELMSMLPPNVQMMMMKAGVIIVQANGYLMLNLRITVVDNQAMVHANAFITGQMMIWMPTTGVTVNVQLCASAILHTILPASGAGDMNLALKFWEKGSIVIGTYHGMLYSDISASANIYIKEGQALKYKIWLPQFLGLSIQSA